MVNDAEQHADEDQKQKELIEAKNNADQMIYTTEKALKDVGDSISEDEKKKIEEAIEKVKSVQSGSDATAIKTALEELTQASHKLAEELYKQQAAQAGQQQGGPQPPPETGAEEKKDADQGEAVDADFEVVDDDKKE